MIVLPIVGRELLVASRRRGTYRLRVLAAAVALVFCGITLITLQVLPSFTAAGGRIFMFLSWVGLAFALLSGVQSTADCLSREKREGTLGLLFLTDLKGFDVVFGKLAAASLTVLYGIVAMLPVLALPLLLGGVTPGEYARVALVWLNSLFFSVAAGMAVSSMSRDERVAVGNSFALVLAVTLAVPMAGMLISQWTGSRGWAELLALITPLSACHLAFQTSYVTQASGFWASLGVTHLLGWACLWLACVCARDAWRDKPPTPRKQRGIPKLLVGSKSAGSFSLSPSDGERVGERGFLAGLTALLSPPLSSLRGRRGRKHQQLRDARRKQGDSRRRALRLNPVFWLLSRARFVRSYPWILLATMVGICVWGAYLGRPMMTLQSILMTGYAAHFLFKWWVATVACRSFAEERENGSLELLLSTPLTAKAILGGVWWSALWLFAYPVAVMVALQLVAIMATWWLVPVHRESVEMASTILINVSVFLLDCWALHWAGLLAGFRTRNPQAVWWKTMLTVLGLPWLGVWGFLAFTLLLVGHLPFEEVSIAIVWMFFSVATDLFFGLRAKIILQGSLRTVAMDRLTDGRGTATTAGAR